MPTVPDAHMCSVRALSTLGLMPSASAASEEMWLWNAVRSGITEPTTSPSTSRGRSPGTESKHALPASQMRSRYVAFRTPNFETPAPTSATLFMGSPRSWLFSTQPPRDGAVVVLLRDLERRAPIIGAPLGVGAVGEQHVHERQVSAKRGQVQRSVASAGGGVDAAARGEERRDDPEIAGARDARVQRLVPVVVVRPRAHVGPRRDQRVHDVRVAEMRGEMERGPSVVAVRADERGRAARELADTGD